MGTSNPKTLSSFERKNYSRSRYRYVFKMNWISKIYSGLKEVFGQDKNLDFSKTFRSIRRYFNESIVDARTLKDIKTAFLLRFSTTSL